MADVVALGAIMMSTVPGCEPATVLDRYELYKMVWTDPVSTVALRLGVSDVGLQKACRRHKIPTPGRGYWAKLRAGLPVSPAPLPYAEGQVVVYGRPSETSSAPMEPEVAAVPEPVNPPALNVDDLLRRRLLPELKATRDFLTSCKTTRNEFVESDGPKLFPIKVSKKLLPRALRTANAILLAGQPHQIALSKSPGHLEVAGEPVRVRLMEKGTWDEKTTNAGSRWSYTRQVVIPNGILCFEIEEWLAAPRRRWSDTKTRTVEQGILGIVDALMRVAEAIRARRVKWEEDERQRRLLEAARQLEADRVQFVEKMAARIGELRTARNVLEFIERQIDGRSSAATGSLLQWLRSRVTVLESALHGPGLDRLVTAARCFTPRDDATVGVGPLSDVLPYLSAIGLTTTVANQSQ